ncbi:MAG: two-component system, OmpR family, response regulator [Blastocatellia bacterium]|nr:two-component system, OmpR family, response regulator [Blastocatellia bacterium]
MAERKGKPFRTVPRQSRNQPAYVSSLMDQILIIDDDVALCELVTEYLEPLGFAVEAVHEGSAGAERALAGVHALVVLDVMLPGLNGFEVLKRIRAHSQVPVLMLTARGDDIDRIVGLEIGADDYLPKPFNPRELSARIRAILRRAQPDQSGSEARPLAVGDVEIESGARVVRRSGEEVDLTSVEYDLLERLLRSAGRIVTREELSKDVLGRNSSPYDRSIDMHISNLRKKLGAQLDQGERIKTVRGVGYIYAYSDQGRGE